jgi:hypothetical protein
MEHAITLTHVACNYSSSVPPRIITTFRVWPLGQLQFELPPENIPPTQQSYLLQHYTSCKVVGGCAPVAASFHFCVSQLGSHEEFMKRALLPMCSASM